MPDSTLVTTFPISPHVSTALATAAGHVSADPFADGDTFATQARSASRLLDGGLGPVLDHFAAGQGPSALRLSGVPMPPVLPATTALSFHRLPHVQPTGAEAVLGVIGARLGEVFAYREWDGAYLVQNRYPIASLRDVQTASGANELVLHTEACFTAYPPDFLALLGLRPGRPEKPEPWSPSFRHPPRSRHPAGRTHRRDREQGGRVRLRRGRSVGSHSATVFVILFMSRVPNRCWPHFQHSGREHRGIAT